MVSMADRFAAVPLGKHWAVIEVGVRVALGDVSRAKAERVARCLNGDAPTPGLEHPMWDRLEADIMGAEGTTP